MAICRFVVILDVQESPFEKNNNSCSLRVAQIQQVRIILATADVVAAMGPGLGLHVGPTYYQL